MSVITQESHGRMMHVYRTGLRVKADWCFKNFVWLHLWTTARRRYSVLLVLRMANCREVG